MENNSPSVFRDRILACAEYLKSQGKITRKKIDIILVLF